MQTSKELVQMEDSTGSKAELNVDLDREKQNYSAAG